MLRDSRGVKSGENLREITVNKLTWRPTNTNETYLNNLNACKLPFFKIK
jgi:hypothetical protein